ncbi:hypothetical protein B0H66DRAFT_570294 [Apodospora peruviana]|uniref:Secreted protein n=1 Tax=Apodospora peruviana TaxID=516989 RepID=A0AAE0HST5_9PEZI|nr:hypothetical protein B0H66DRAFT_570294 [Apodospora peruviana]
MMTFRVLTYFFATLYLVVIRSLTKSSGSSASCSGKSTASPDAAPAAVVETPPSLASRLPTNPKELLRITSTTP